MKKRIAGMIMTAVFTLTGVTLYADVLDELRYLPEAPDYMIYLDAQSFIRYFEKNGIAAGDLHYLFGEKEAEKSEKLFAEYGLRVEDFENSLLAGSINGDTGSYFMIALVSLKQGRFSFPENFEGRKIKSEYGTIYKVDDEKDICLSYSAGIIAGGTRESVERYLKARASGKAEWASGLGSRALRASKSAMYGFIGVNDFMKSKMDMGLALLSTKLKNIEKNVFIKALFEARSLEFGIDLEGVGTSETIIAARSEAEADRLVMLSSTVIVASSFAVLFVDKFASGYSGKGKELLDQQYFENVQESFGRITISRRENNAVIRAEGSLEAQEKMLAALKTRIEEEKNKRKTRLEQEAAEKVISAVRSASEKEALAALEGLKNINAVDDKGNTALIAAVESGRMKLVQQIISKKADVNVLNASERDALSYAVEMMKTDICRTLIDKGARVDRVYSDGSGLIHMSAAGGNSEIVEMLASRLTSIDVRNASGETGLHVASAAGHASAVRALLKHGAGHEAKDDNGLRPIDRAQASGHKEVVEIFSKRFKQKPVDITKK